MDCGTLGDQNKCQIYDGQIKTKVGFTRYLLTLLLKRKDITVKKQIICSIPETGTNITGKGYIFM